MQRCALQPSGGCSRPSTGPRGRARAARNTGHLAGHNEPCGRTRKGRAAGQEAMRRDTRPRGGPHRPCGGPRAAPGRCAGRATRRSLPHVRVHAGCNTAAHLEYISIQQDQQAANRHPGDADSRGEHHARAPARRPCQASCHRCGAWRAVWRRRGLAVGAVLGPQQRCAICRVLCIRLAARAHRRCAARRVRRAPARSTSGRRWGAAASRPATLWPEPGHRPALVCPEPSCWVGNSRSTALIVLSCDRIDGTIVSNPNATPELARCHR